ncbi:MAG: hypothetical protein GY749_07040 [Desulfobacteraceae bacterium]|nr:hypothetical protein [Desulfobacteraceae bacterium]
MTQQIATFVLGDTLLGVDILLVKEIYRQMSFSQIPDAPEHFLGLMNLRGRVVTVIDLNVCLNRPAASYTDDSRLLILKTQEEIMKSKIRADLEDVNMGEDIVGFLIDRMDDVINVEEKEILPPPPNLVEVEEELVQGVIKQGDQLVILLNITAVLERAMSVTTDTDV